MKKVLVFTVVIALTLILASAAFAQPQSAVVYGNAQNGSVSYGSHGHSWYSDGAVGEDPVIPENAWFEPVVVEGVFQDNSSESGKWHSFVDSQGKVHYYFVPEDTEPVLVEGISVDNSNESGAWYSYFDSVGNEYHVPVDNHFINSEWEFYRDSRGVLHYFYVNQDREGEYHHYTDQNGVSQYYYEYTD